MKKRLFVLVLMLVALSLVPFASSAQSDTCFNLSADDCAIIAGAAANSQQNITSFVQSFGLTVTGSDLDILAAFAPEVPAAFSLTVTGSGPFAFTPDDMDAPVTMSLPMEITIDGESLSFPLAITNGFLYTQLDGELVGIPLAAAEDAEVGGMDASGVLEANPANLAELFDLTGADAAGVAGQADAMTSAFVNYIRLADADMMGQTVYPFEFTLDITGLLNSPEFVQTITGLGGMLGGMGGEGTEGAELDMVFQLLPIILSGVDSDLAVTQSVGADDNFVHRLEFDFNFAIDLGILMGAAGGNSEAPAMPPVTLGVNFWVELSDINAPVTVEAPAGARELTAEEAEALLSALESQIGSVTGALGGF